MLHTVMTCIFSVNNWLWLYSVRLKKNYVLEVHMHKIMHDFPLAKCRKFKLELRSEAIVKCERSFKISDLLAD